ncbi:MAG: potassium transporter TrkH [Erythrobacter sp. SCN 62-14]|nr:MAG: potassium transporter TrkH [Erythrobacter sp. SCN 62-14]
MTFDQALSGFAAIGLLAYLTLVLLKPERF